MREPNHLWWFMTHHSILWWTHGQRLLRVARSQQKKKENQEKDAQPEKIKRKFDFSDLRNPPKNFMPLFREVAKFRTLTEKEEQQSRDGDLVERCLPQNT